MVIAYFQAQETTFVRLRETLRPRPTLLQALTPRGLVPTARLQANLRRLISKVGRGRSVERVVGGRPAAAGAFTLSNGLRGNWRDMVC